jgi:hypothetical protein
MSDVNCDCIITKTFLLSTTLWRVIGCISLLPTFMLSTYLVFGDYLFKLLSCISLTSCIVTIITGNIYHFIPCALIVGGIYEYLTKQRNAL